MRAFLACLPPPDCLAALQAWQAGLQECAGGKPLPAAQLHLTLAFLGEATPLQLQSAADCAERAAESLPAALVLDACGSWRDLGWCGPRCPPDDLNRWAERLRADLRAAGVATDGRPYRPHVTLLRGLARPLPARRLPPLVWPLEEVVLLASELRAAGACYRRLDGWRRPDARPGVAGAIARRE
ncbi:RNA 2',3'-cyclic phosphodiesterase [Chromobacterium phragmitis]|uniref:RNA 2',3'-cyclic phosphodiesterase n=1 Tax=Chromobacterium phragmitis TaxID=2202141 RepID=A0ABV0IVE8_9NEIS